MTPAPSNAATLAPTSSPNPNWFDSDFCAVTNSSDCLLWGVPWQYLVISAVLFLAAAFMGYLLTPIFGLGGLLLDRYKKPLWKEEIYSSMFVWTVHLARWGLVWAGYTTLQLPPNWTAVLRYIFPIPFVISLFFWTNALGDCIANIGYTELQSRSGGSTKAVGFVEIVRVGKYVAFIIVLFIAVVIFGGNIVAFLNDAKLFGLIVVFALQPWLKNLVGGMTIFYDEKYVLGDEIRYAGTQGVVSNITLRATRVERADNSVAIIPNGRLLEQPLANISQRESYSIVVRIPLDFNANIDKVEKLIASVNGALETLHPAILSHYSWADAKGIDDLGSGNSKRISVSLEGDFELTVKTFARIDQLRGIVEPTVATSVTSPATNAGLASEEATVAVKKIVSDMVIAITEQMSRLGISRRVRVKGRSTTGTVTESIISAQDHTNDDDNDYTIALMGFYI